MTSVVEQGVRGGSAIAAASRLLGERDQEVVAQLRERGREALSQLALPDPKAERPWKYLDIRDLEFGAYKPKAMGLTLKDERQEGLSAVAFEGAAGKDAEAIARHLGSRVAAAKSALTALHYALLNCGVLVRTEANAEPREPVRIVRELNGDHVLAAPHTLIVTGANSRVTIIDEFRSGAGDALAIPAVEIVPGPGSEVKYTVLHRWGTSTRVFSEQRTATERDSGVVSLSVVTGGSVVKSHIESALEGRGSSSEILGISLGNGKQHADFYTLQDHIGPDTRSDLLIKSALEDQSRSVYYGLTRVGLGARNADANQENRNLLLSKAAKADSDPVLEILTNNVIRASHGATAGPVDEEQLYYLETRGIPRPQAEDLLVWGFVSQVLDRVPSAELREELSAVLEEKLGHVG